MLGTQRRLEALTWSRTAAAHARLYILLIEKLCLLPRQVACWKVYWKVEKGLQTVYGASVSEIADSTAARLSLKCIISWAKQDEEEAVQ